MSPPGGDSHAAASPCDALTPGQELPIGISEQPQSPAPVREAQPDLAHDLLPGWLDQDLAADEPSALGYTLSVLPLLIVVLCFIGMAIFLHR